MPELVADDDAELRRGRRAPPPSWRRCATSPTTTACPRVLRDVYGLPYQEIADVTGRPLGTVKVMVHRGRASLRLQQLRASGARREET